MAIALLASATGQGANAATSAAIDTTGATLLVAVVGWDLGTTPTIADSKSNSWTACTIRSSSIGSVCIFYSTPTTVGASHTVTATASGLEPGIAVAAFSGAAASSVFDQENGAANDASATLATGSVTPGQANELLIAGIATVGSNTPSSIDTGFTFDGKSSDAGFTHTGIAHLIETTATAKNPTWTQGGASNIAVAIATFKMAVVVPLPAGGAIFTPPVRAVPRPSYGFLSSLNLPLVLYVPPPPPAIATYGWHWPNPMRVPNTTAAQRGFVQSLNIPLLADYFYALVYVSVGGIPRAQGHTGAGSIDFETLTITDILDETPNTCTFTARGFVPVAGQEVIVTLGSATRQNPARLFAGTILNVTPDYSGGPLNTFYTVNCIDWTWQLNRRKVNARYTTTPVWAIAQDLIANNAPGFTAAGCTSAYVIDVITFTNQDLSACLTQLARRAGVPWNIDAYKDCRMPATDGTVPIPLTPAHPSLTAFSSRSDLGQWITRTFSEGGGGTAAAAVAVGETILPVTDASWYEDVVGVVACGPQRIVYAGRTLGGGGGLVGPGASPTAAPAMAIAGGGGVETGSHDYAVTFVTAAGESIPGPRATIAVGTIAAPASAPTPGSPTAGGSLNVTDGDHRYAVTFVTAAGETTGSPLSGIVTAHTDTGTTITDPATAPTVGTPGTGGALDTGSHEWVATFVGGAGETLAGPVSSAVAVGAPAPTVAPTFFQSAGLSSNGPYTPNTPTLRYTFMYGSVESLPTAGVAISLDGTHGWTVTIPTGGAGVTSRRVYVNAPGYTTGERFRDLGNNTTTGLNDFFYAGDSAGSPPSTDQSTASVPLTNIPTSAQSITSRKLYRRFNGAGTFKYVATISGNATTTYTDTAANSALGADAPSSNTTAGSVDYSVVPLTGIPIGGALVTSRKLYRTQAGGSQLMLVATIANNTATTYSDSTRDGLLGANIPTSNTAAANQVAVSAIQIGGATVTSRKVYRTAAGGSQLKLLTTLADNTTTTYADSTADASLGANVPAGDTSGLTQPNGQVAAGATTLIVAGTSAFAAGGGWAVIGNGQQVIRYTGVTATGLTGIPAVGAGAIVASIGYNSTVTAAPQLIGIPASGPGSILYAIVKGDPVNLVVQVDDVAGQAARSTLLDPFNLLGGAAGIQEDYQQDGRIGHAEAVARATARLQLQGAIAVSISYTVRDPLQQSGRFQAVDLPAPTSVTGTFKIQQVVISQFSASPLLFPTYVASASTARYSFEQLLASLRTP
jgi:hypothetical protein